MVKTLLALICLLGLFGCQIKEGVMEETDAIKEEIEVEKEEVVMKLLINGQEMPVIWLDNQSVKELMEEAGNGDIIVSMSMYGGNEQFGHLGRSYSSDDERITTNCGDIVLYCGNQIVLFYGSNTWEYTRLGRIDLPNEEVTELLSNGNITLALRR